MILPSKRGEATLSSGTVPDQIVKRRTVKLDDADRWTVAY